MRLSRVHCYQGNFKIFLFCTVIIINLLVLLRLAILHNSSSWHYTNNRRTFRNVHIPSHIAKMMEIRDFSGGLDVPIQIFGRNNDSSLWMTSEEYIAMPLRFGEMTQEERDGAGWMEMVKIDPEVTLNFTPPVPRYSINDIVYQLPRRITEDRLSLNRRLYENHTVVILTPIHNSENDLAQYGHLIAGLDYPHHLISVVFGEDSSEDETMPMAKHLVKALRKEGFNRVQLHSFNISSEIGSEWIEKHRRVSQYKRRRHLAEARNLLLQAGLKDEDYVMWLDSDISHIPSDLIQQLIFADKDIVTPCCLFSKGRYKRIYDKNIWRETPLSLKDQEKLPKNAIVVEGYGATTRIYLPHLQGEGRIVPVDGVGGCSLLVKAKCHRQGLDFPEIPYKRHIETEGLAKKAQDMGYTVYGLPFLNVFHK